MLSYPRLGLFKSHTRLTQFVRFKSSLINRMATVTTNKTSRPNSINKKVNFITMTTLASTTPSSPPRADNSTSPKPILEVERKFNPTAHSLNLLRTNRTAANTPIFTQHTFLGPTTTHDTYYDRTGDLAKAGVYIRRRNGIWQAKTHVAVQKPGHETATTAVRETVGEAAVKKLIEAQLHIAIAGVNIEDVLEEWAAFVTERESWTVEGRFKIDVDETDFGFCVGEVEVLINEGDGNGKEDALRKLEGGEVKPLDGEDVKKLELEVEAFMAKHRDVFPGGDAKSKLTAYGEWKTKQTTSGNAKAEPSS